MEFIFLDHKAAVEVLLGARDFRHEPFLESISLNYDLFEWVCPDEGARNDTRDIHNPTLARNY